MPIAVIFIIASIDGLASFPSKVLPFRRLVWSAICWFALAKPWFFTGPYLTRQNSILPAYKAIRTIPKSSRVSSTSYLVPHLSQRVKVTFPSSSQVRADISNLDVLLLNPMDPGWASDSNLQLNFLLKAKEEGWECINRKNGLELCLNPSLKATENQAY